MAWDYSTEPDFREQMITFPGAQVLHDVIDRARQIHGALGHSTDMPLEAMYRFARGARLYEGPAEVHRHPPRGRSCAATSRRAGW